MDILIHTLSGTTTAGFIVAFSKSSIKDKLLLVLLGGFAGAFPDIDALSLWGGFDRTIGKWLHLSHSGSDIYFGKFWYSHHGFFHSLLAAFLFAFIFILIRKNFFKNLYLKEYIKTPQTKGVFAVCFFAYVSHLLGDLPTPGAVWGGVRLFFPFNIYIGGYGTTWWWNNYDVFLSLAISTIFFVLLILLNKRFYSTDYLKLSIGLYMCCVGFCFYFVTHRSISYAYTGNTVRYAYYERSSKIDQYRRLGKNLYFKMIRLDNKIPLYF